MTGIRVRCPGESAVWRCIPAGTAGVPDSTTARIALSTPTPRQSSPAPVSAAGRQDTQDPLPGVKGSGEQSEPSSRPLVNATATSLPMPLQASVGFPAMSFRAGACRKHTLPQAWPAWILLWLCSPMLHWHNEQTPRYDEWIFLNGEGRQIPEPQALVQTSSSASIDCE
jgi:hypothetical protein